MMAFSACNNSSGTSGAEISYRLESITVNDEELSFQIYLEREDLRLIQPDNDGNLLISELPIGVRPQSIVSEGLNCILDEFPHVCTASDMESVHSLTIVFEDNMEGILEVKLPNVEPFNSPEITSPIIGETKGSEMSRLKFEEIGADQYIVTTSLCYPYANDGVNPCLDSESFEIIKNNDGEFVMEDNPNFYSAELNKRGADLELLFEFGDDLAYYDTLIYEVAASKIGEVDGVETFSESKSELEIPLNEEDEVAEEA